MNTHKRFACCLAGVAGLSVGPRRLGGATVFLGPPGGPGSVQVLDLAGIRSPEVPPGLQGIRLLPIDFVGRTQLDQYRPDRPRLRDDVPLFGRLELPGRKGSLYRYSRENALGAIAFGFLRVDPLGEPWILVERTVPSAAWGDPFVDEIAVSPHGDEILVATRLDDGGDLFEVSVDTGVVRERTGLMWPLAFGHFSLALSDTWGCAVSSWGILRFDCASPGDATGVSFESSPAPTWFGDGIVMSGNGAWAACIAGAGYSQSLPFVFGAHGSARPASPESFSFVGPGFLPDHLDGPYLAVSDDGLRCAWRAAATSSDGYDGEVYVSALSPTTPPSVLHLTADSIFEPYLDEVGVFQFRPDGRLLFAAAEAPASTGSGMIGMDLFQMTPVAGAGEFFVENLSLSSGDPAPPFLNQPTLVPSRVHWIPAAQAFLVHASTVGSETHGAVLRVDPDMHSVTEVVHEAEMVNLLEMQGNDVVLSTLESSLEEGVLWHLPPSLDSANEVSLSEASRIVRAAVGPLGLSAMIVDENGLEVLYLVRITTGESWRLALEHYAFGPAFSFLPDGSVVASLGAPGAPAQFLRWTAGSSPRALRSPRSPGFVMPGG